MNTRGIEVLMITSDLAEGQFLASELSARLAPGATAQAVGTLEHALEHLTRNHFDLMITDLSLADSEGLDTVNALRAADSESSIIVRARAEEATLSLAAVRAGAEDCVVGSGHCAGALFRSADFALERLRRVRSERREQHVRKLEAVGRFSAGAARHYNNLLCVLLGNATLLKESLGSIEQFRQPLDDMLEAADRARIITRHLMLFCGGSPPAPALHDVNQLLADLEPVLRDALGEDTDLVLGPLGAQEPVFVDRTSLEQALLILALSGRDRVNRGGRITLSTRLLDGPRGAHVHDRNASREPFVVIQITDEGADLHPRVPHRPIAAGSYRPEPDVLAGTHLAAVHGVVRRAGGFIEVEAHPGGGRSLSIGLPARGGACAAN